MLAQSVSNLYELAGIIKEVKINGSTNKFVIKSMNGGKEYIVDCEYFCPARPGDGITGICELTETGKIRYMQDPLVEINFTKEIIMKEFVISLKGTGFGKWMTEKLYKFLSGKTREIIGKKQEYMNEGIIRNRKCPIYQNRNIVGVAVMETINWYAYRYKGDETVEDIFINIGMTKQQINKLLKWWYKKYVLRRLYLLGITKREITECIYVGWTPNVLYYQLITNPYVVEKINMQKVGNIIKKYDLKLEPGMVEAGNIIRWIDKTNEENGWMCISKKTIDESIQEMHKYLPIILDKCECIMKYDCIYFKYKNEIEKTIARVCHNGYTKEVMMDMTESKLYEDQMKGVRMVCQNKVSIITGGGGTGKSTIIREVYEGLKRNKMNVMIGAFTGKAVARLKQIIGKESDIMTLHMLLGRNMEKLDCLIIDEMSMVPNVLFGNICLKVSSRCMMILVGDPNQLQPIEGGDLFNQLIDSDMIPKHHLMEVYRTNNKVLMKNLQNWGKFEWGSGCNYINGGLVELDNLLIYLKKEKVKHEDIVVITPYKKDTERVNERIIKIFFEEGGEWITDMVGKKWRVGCRVMMRTNRYDIGIMNGEEGIITKIYNNKPCIQVTFGQKQLDISTINKIETGDDIKPLTTKLITLSWCITIHKSQGSEWNDVIVYLPGNSTGDDKFCNKKLLYTAISRTKKNLYVISPNHENFQKCLSILPPSRLDNLKLCLQEFKI